MVLRTGLLLFGILLAGCVARGTPLPGQVVDEGYEVGGFRWDSGTTVYVMTTTFNADGKVGVCGAWVARGGANLVANFHSEALGAGIVMLGGRRILQDLNFMQEHKTQEDLRGKATNCVRSGVAWMTEFENVKPSTRFPRMRVNI